MALRPWLPAGAAGLFGSGPVYGKGSAFELFTIQALNRSLTFALVSHLDETETA